MAWVTHWLNNWGSAWEWLADVAEFVLQNKNGCDNILHAPFKVVLVDYEETTTPEAGMTRRTTRKQCPACGNVFTVRSRLE